MPFSESKIKYDWLDIDMLANDKKSTRTRGPFFARIEGLHVSLRSARSPNAIKKGMLVSHSFVELFREITEDKGFTRSLFDMLREDERDFLRYVLKMTKVESRGFESAYNKTISHMVDKLNLLQNAISIGDDNPIIIKEMQDLLNRLYEKNVFSTGFFTQYKKAFSL
jgi:hypothetical protein